MAYKKAWFIYARARCQSGLGVNVGQGIHFLGRIKR